MAEGSIRIADALTGPRMATTDAVEPDGSSNARVMERVTFGSGKLTSPLGNSTRGNSAAISSAETADVTSLPADLTGNLITVGDKSMLVVTAEQTVSGGTVTVTPIVYDNEGTPGVFGCLESKLFTQAGAFRRGAGSGTYLMNVQRWDVSGAYKIGLHVTSITGTSNGVKLWGRVI
jgi:hypothetical protein